jgi:hypothetical protein
MKNIKDILTKTWPRCQGANQKRKQKRAFKSGKNCSYTSQSFQKRDKVITFLHNTTHAVLDTLNEIVLMCDNFAHVFISQQVLANRASLCRTYTNECIAKLVKAGVLQTRRPHGKNKTLSYFIHPILYRTDTRVRIRRLLPALMKPSLTGVFLQDPTLFHKYTFDINIIREQEGKFYKTIKQKISRFKDSNIAKYYQKALESAVNFHKSFFLGTPKKGTSAPPPVRTYPPQLQPSTKCRQLKKYQKREVPRLTPKTSSFLAYLQKEGIAC